MTKNAYKLKQIGITKFVLTYFGLLMCIVLFIFGSTQLTTKSEYVSGYTRSNGTHVNSYYRRPSGGAIHDAPYESLSLASGIGSFVLGIIGFSLFKSFKEFNVEEHFKKNLKYIDELPKNDYTEINVPTISIKPKKDWICSRYKKVILAGTLYYCFNNESQSNHRHVCEKCTNELIVLKIENNKQKQEYNKRLAEIKAKREYQYICEYKKQFNEEPNCLVKK